MVNEDRVLRQKIHSVFTKKHQLSLRSNATELLAEVLKALSSKQIDPALNVIVETYLQQDGKLIDFPFLGLTGGMKVGKGKTKF